MESLHVKFEFEDARNSKKELLSAEIAMLNSAKKLQDYLKMRSLELEQKSALRKKAKELSLALKNLKSLLPKTKNFKEETPYKLSINEKMKLEDELKSVKERLEKLNQ